MILRFDEEMRGLTADGRKFALRLHVEANPARRLVLAQTMKLTGEADLERVVRAAPLEGTLIVGIPWRRVMRYEFAFPGADHARYRFVGQKDVRYTRPRESLTTLAGALTRDGEPFTDATVTFSWADLSQFLRSFRVE